MFANKFTIKQGSVTGDTIEIPITITQEHGVVGQTDLIKNEFVAVERKKSINDIIDYEKVRFLPANIDNILMETINYNLHFYNSDSGSFDKITWGAIDFSQEDLEYKKNRFKKSFLQLSFYDSNNLLGQNLLFIVTLFPQYVSSDNLLTSSLIEFVRENPIIKPNGFAEGFYVYFYKDLVDLDTDYDLYMKPTFFNVATGKGTPLMVSNSVTSYDNEITDRIHLKYNFKKDSNGYLYSIDDTNGVVVYDLSDKKIKINLYELVVV